MLSSTAISLWGWIGIGVGVVVLILAVMVFLAYRYIKSDDFKLFSETPDLKLGKMFSKRFWSDRKQAKQKKAAQSS